MVVMAGQCAVESEPQLMEAARLVKAAGASVLRGGAFKPRTSPFSFQGLEKAGSILSYGLLLPFGLVWLALSLRRSGAARLVLLLFLGVTAVYALFISKVRFRLPLDLFIILYAAACLLSLGGWLRDRLASQGRRWGWLTALVGETAAENDQPT